MNIRHIFLHHQFFFLFKREGARSRGIFHLLVHSPLCQAGASSQKQHLDLPPGWQRITQGSMWYSLADTLTGKWMSCRADKIETTASSWYVIIPSGCLACRHTTLGPFIARIFNIWDIFNYINIQAACHFSCVYLCVVLRPHKEKCIVCPVCLWCNHSGRNACLVHLWK